MMPVPLDAMSDMSDDALLVLYANGDPQGSVALTARLTSRILGHALRVLGDRYEAEDVTQEAMLRLWKIAPQWQQDRAKVTTWVYGVVANLCRDRLRKKRTYDLDDLSEPMDDSPSAADGLQDQARRDALQAALMRLPARQRQAIVLRHIDGLANPEIATIMEQSVEAVESLIARGKRALSAQLQHKRDELGYTR